MGIEGSPPQTGDGVTVPNAVTPPTGNTSAPARGPQAWMDMGAARLTGLGVDDATIARMRAAKDGQDLLMNASGVTPGSVRMDAILREIRRFR